MSKSTHAANVGATLYDGQIDTWFDCSGVQTCPLALCPIMPPDGSEECTYKQDGSCVSPAARLLSVNALRDRMSTLLKKLDEEVHS